MQRWGFIGRSFDEKKKGSKHPSTEYFFMVFFPPSFIDVEIVPIDQIPA